MRVLGFGDNMANSNLSFYAAFCRGLALVTTAESDIKPKYNYHGCLRNSFVILGALTKFFDPAIQWQFIT